MENIYKTIKTLFFCANRRQQNLQTDVTLGFFGVDLNVNSALSLSAFFS